MKLPLPAEYNDSEYDDQDREIVRILKELGNLQATYPPEHLAARRAAFLTKAERLRSVELDEEFSAEDGEVIRLLGNLKSAEAAYPSELLAARRSAFVRQLEIAGGMTLWDRIRVSVQRIFPSKTIKPTLSLAGFRHLSPAIAGLVAALLIGALFLSRAEQILSPAPSQSAATPTPLSPASSSDVAVLLCTPGDQTTSCPSGDLGPRQDLAEIGNGLAQPAVSSQSGSDGVHVAAYVNDGRSSTTWVSKNADSWVKIDLGNVKTINAVSLQKGSPGTSQASEPGQFVIAVALSDLYADGNSSNDHLEYAQVFNSEQTGFSGTVSDAQTILTQFPPVKARFVKITFEKAGAAIKEAGVFLMPPVLAEQGTRKPPEESSEMTAPPMATNTASAVDTTLESATAVPSDTPLPTLTNTLPPQDTSTPLPTDTLLPTDTSIPVPTDPLPSDTPIPLPILGPPTAQDSPASTDPIIVTGHDQTLTYFCNGNAVEIRGHANIVTLLGSCSITVTGNRNQVFWEFGSPLITNQGKDNLISQP